MIEITQIQVEAVGRWFASLARKRRLNLPVSHCEDGHGVGAEEDDSSGESNEMLKKHVLLPVLCTVVCVCVCVLCTVSPVSFVISLQSSLHATHSPSFYIFLIALNTGEQDNADDGGDADELVNIAGEWKVCGYSLSLPCVVCPLLAYWIPSTSLGSAVSSSNRLFWKILPPRVSWDLSLGLRLPFLSGFIRTFCSPPFRSDLHTCAHKTTAGHT